MDRSIKASTHILCCLSLVCTIFCSLGKLEAQATETHLNNSHSITPNSTPSNEQVPKPMLSFQVINNADETFGYDISKNGQMLIHQPYIPAIAGNKGFKTKSDAAKVAKFVVDKINRGEMPPSVSIEELKHLHAIN